MVTAGHEEGVWEEQLEAEEGEDALHAEGASVHEVSVEEVGVVGAGQTVQREYVHEVVELSVDVAAHGELGGVGDRHVYQARLAAGGSEASARVNFNPSLQALRRCLRRTFHFSNFYTLLSCSPGHAISKNLHGPSVALFLPVVVNFRCYSREFNGKWA